MARADQTDDETKTGRGGDDPGLFLSLAVCLFVGATAGAGFGFLTPPRSGGTVAAQETTDQNGQGVAKTTLSDISGRFPNDAVEIAMPPIIMTIGTDQKTNVRLDLSIIAVHGTAKETPLSSEVREDVVAFLRGLKLEDLEGGRGFLNLRAQLDERARIRGRGVILGLLIGGLIFQ